jgi:hypothetical protein
MVFGVEMLARTGWYIWYSIGMVYMHLAGIIGQLSGPSTLVPKVETD